MAQTKSASCLIFLQVLYRISELTARSLLQKSAASFTMTGRILKQCSGPGNPKTFKLPSGEHKNMPGIFEDAEIYDGLSFLADKKTTKS